jgi:hypothetical protein
MTCALSRQRAANSAGVKKSFISKRPLSIVAPYPEPSRPAGMALIAHACKSLMINTIKLMRFGRKSGTGAREAETCRLLKMEASETRGGSPPSNAESSPREHLKWWRRCRVALSIGSTTRKTMIWAASSLIRAASSQSACARRRNDEARKSNTSAGRVKYEHRRHACTRDPKQPKTSAHENISSKTFSQSRRACPRYRSRPCLGESLSSGGACPNNAGGGYLGENKCLSCDRVVEYYRRRRWYY